MELAEGNCQRNGHCETPPRGERSSPNILSKVVKSLFSYRRSSKVKHPNIVVVRYKNSSFIQSPSLVMMGKEQKSFRRQPKFLSLCRHLRARMGAIQAEYDYAILGVTLQKQLAEENIVREKELEEQLHMAETRNIIMSEQLSQTEFQLESTIQQLNQAQAEYHDTKQALKMAKSEIQKFMETNTNLEKRLFQLNETLDLVKNKLNQKNNAKTDIDDFSHSQTVYHDKNLKALNKQLAELSMAHKKQLFLVDNLKRQNLCMRQTHKMLFGQDNLNKILEP